MLDVFDAHTLIAIQHCYLRIEPVNTGTDLHVDDRLVGAEAEIAQAVKAKHSYVHLLQRIKEEEEPVIFQRFFRAQVEIVVAAGLTEIGMQAPEALYKLLLRFLVAMDNEHLITFLYRDAGLVIPFHLMPVISKAWLDDEGFTHLFKVHAAFRHDIVYLRQQGSIKLYLVLLA